MSQETKPSSSFSNSYLMDALKQDREFILQEVAASDTQGKPTDRLLRYLFEKRFNLALVPNFYGGHGLDYISEFNLILEAARLDGTFGWIIFQLIGNPGRVLSYFSPKTVMNLLETHHGEVIFTYQNDASKATVRREGKYLTVSGKWTFGTLSKSATHFVVPFVDPLTSVEMCLILRPGQVRQTDDWKNGAFRGASICSYEVIDHLVLEDDLVAPIQLANPHFCPLFKIPRSAIKHLAWSLGMALNSIDALTGIDPVRARSPEWVRYADEVEAMLTNTRKGINSLLDKVLIDSAEVSVKILSESCPSVHKHTLNGVLSAFFALPQTSLDETSVVSRNLRNTIVLSLHKALRDGLYFH